MNTNLKNEMTDTFLCFFKTKEGLLKFFVGSDTADIPDADMQKIVTLMADVFGRMESQKKGNEILNQIK